MLVSHKVTEDKYTPFTKDEKGVVSYRFGNTKRLILKVDNIVSELALSKAKPEILSFEGERNIRNNVKRIEVLGGPALHLSLVPPEFYYYTNMYEIIFNDNGAIQNNMELEREFDKKKIPPALRELAKDAIQKMSSELGWKNKFMPMTVDILCYEMTKEEPSLTDFPWHRDHNSLSMTALISPYSEGGTGFTGAHLSAGKRVSSFDEYSRRRDNKESTTESSHTVELEYPYRGGFIFDNLGTEHKVHDMSLLNPEKPYQRWLLTVFADPSQSEIGRLSEQYKERNLAQS